MSREAIAENLRVATTKCKQLGVSLSWNDGDKFSWFRHYTTHDITSEEEYRFELLPKDFISSVVSPEGTIIQPERAAQPGLDEYLLLRGLKSGHIDQDCTLLALGAFHYALESDPEKPKGPGKERFGLTAGRAIVEDWESSEPIAIAGCATPDRTDKCCNTIKRRTGSGVIYRDVWPSYIFRYVLAHEIGHYLGLCHVTHNGVQDIMFSAAFNSALSWNLLEPV